LVDIDGCEAAAFRGCFHSMTAATSRTRFWRDGAHTFRGAEAHFGSGQSRYQDEVVKQVKKSLDRVVLLVVK
jgi:hypothetical protein